MDLCHGGDTGAQRAASCGSLIHLSRTDLCERPSEKTTTTYFPSHVTSLPNMASMSPCAISLVGPTSGWRSFCVISRLEKPCFVALLCKNLDALTQKTDELDASNSPGEALLSWFDEWMAFAHHYKGVAAMISAHRDPTSALYAPCAKVHSASARLLLRAQAEGAAHSDMNGDDLFGLMAALGWLGNLPSFAPRAGHLSNIVTSAILTSRSAPPAE